MTSNLLSLARDLQRRKARRRRRLAVIEGVRLVEEALTAAVAFRGALVGPGFGETEREAAVLRDLADHAVPTVDVSPRELREATDTRTPQGIAAIIEIPAWTLEAIQPGGAPVLVLDAVRDPGNVGSLLRTAWALGSPGAVLLDGSADLANPKVIRAGMGATLRFAAATAGVRQFAEWSRSAGLTVWVAAAEGTPIQRLEAPPKPRLSGPQPFVCDVQSRGPNHAGRCGRSCSATPRRRRVVLSPGQLAAIVQALP